MIKFNIFKNIAIALITIGMIKNFLFIIPTINEPAPIGKFYIDNISYIKGAEDILKEKNILNLKDMYHSPGFQIFLAGILFLFGGKLAAVKILFCVFTLLITLLIIYIGEKYFIKGTGYLGGVFSAFSLSFTLYSATIQYEILVTLLILIVCLLTIRNLLRGQKIMFFMEGVILSFICLINIRFIALTALIFIYILIVSNFKKNIALPLVLMLIGALLVIMPWSIYHSLREKRVVVIHTPRYLSVALKRCFNPNSKGDASPSVKITEPSGLNFIIKHPVKSFLLTKERFLHFWNLRTNIWGINAPRCLMRFRETFYYAARGIGKFINVAYLLIFIFGASLSAVERKRMNLPFDKIAIFYFIVIGIMIVPLFITGSPRFCVPMLPYIYLYQAYFTLRIPDLFKIQALWNNST